MSASIAHAETYTFFTKWGSPGSGDGQFSVVWGVAVDSTGNVYATDINNNCIQKFNSSGTFITKWGSPGSGNEQFNQPFGVAVDSLGNVYVADTENNRIQKFDNTGTFITKWGSFGFNDGELQSPKGVAVDSAGDVYVADTLNNRIQKFSSTGTFITKWGSPGSGDGQFGLPVGVAVDSTDNIYVLSQGTSCIQKFDSTGTFITKWGSFGTNDGELYYPNGVAVDSSGNVYVADNGNNRIQKFNGTGAFITKWGSFGTNDGELYSPNGVAVNSSGNVYVTDPGNQRIQVFVQAVLPAANFSSNVTSGYAPLSVQFSDSSENATSRNWDFGDGNNSTVQNPVHTYYTAGNYTVNLTASNANGTDSMFANITVSERPVISVGRYAYITNVNSHNVSVIDTVTNTVTTSVDIGNYPYGVAASQDGTKVYVTDMVKNVTVIDTATNNVTASVEVGNNPQGIAVNPEGTKVYVANYDSNNVSVIDTSSNTVTTSVPVGSNPVGIAVSPDGTKVYVANYNSAEVSVIDAVNNTVTTSVPVGVLPSGVAFTPDGTKVYVTNLDSSNVSVINTTTNTVTASVPVSTSPDGIGVKPDGTRIYVTNRDNAIVSVINATTDTVIDTVSVGGSPRGVSVTPNGTKVYVANMDDNNVSVIDTTNNTVIATVNVGSNPAAFGQFIGGQFIELIIPVANFSANVTSGYVPLSVQFNDSSENATEWNWDFGDGANSTEQNPIHTFSAVGNYTVNLTASNENGTDSTFENITVLEQPILPEANFSTNVTSGYAPLSVQFSDNSENATGLSWDFNNDSLPDSFDANPTYVFGAGNHTVSLTASNENGTDSQSITINVSQTTHEITWSNPADITYGTELDGTQLNASASVPGNFTYTPAEGTILGAGNQTLNVDFTPTDAANYTNASENVSINVLQAAPEITWNNPQDILYGTALNETQSNASASVNGTLTYSPVAGTVLGVGQHTLQVDFTPTDAANYTNVSQNVSINVTSATPTITWSNPDDIAYGTPLSSTQLNTSASVDGNLVYTPTNGTMLSAGQHTLQAEFIPEDTTNYTNASANVSINVTQATSEITWDNPADIVYGTALNGTQLNATASFNGSFVYTPENGTVLGVGQHTLRTDFTPADAANYTNASKNVTANVSSATPVITWSSPSDIVYGTELNGTHLNATASVNGNFTYIPATGSVLGAGQHTLRVDLTPADAANYTNASKKVTINVSAQPILPVANFSTNVTEGYAPLSVQFNDSSTNATSWNWNFGEGNNSTDRNPIHVYVTSGNYTVNLTASNGNGTNSTFANITVLEQPGLVANLYLSINALESKHPGSSMNYTLYYQNFGNKTAQNVVLEDVLSSDVEFESASDGGIYNNSTRTVRWDIGSVAPTEYGYRAVTVEIPLNVTNGTVIYNNASINSSDPESTYDDNEISIQTLVASQNLPENVSVEPTVGDADTPSVYWGEPITFSYHTCDSATGVNISIHIDDGQSDIVGNMTGGPSNWNYTTTFYPRTGKATVNYTVYGCDQAPVSFNIYVDPAGYIYDIDTGNRIANASVWLQRPDGTGSWENVPTGQNPAISQPDTNPLITDNNGMYQWDVLNGTYRVHVEATGYEPKNSYAVTVPPAVTDLHVGLVRVPNANYSIFKSVIDPDPTGDCIINKAGDKVPYRIVVKNEGEVNLTNVTVSDTLISPLPEPNGDDTDPGVLNTGETWIYDAVYTLTSEDVENGSINNNATVTCDQLPEKSSSVSTPVDQNAELSIYKSVTGIDETGDNIINEAGDVINYQVAVKNNGNIDLTDVLVSDLMVDLTKRTGDRSDSGVLNPGETWVYAGNYTVIQEDIDRAKVGNVIIENTATVSCSQLSDESSSLELPIIYIPPDPPNVLAPEPENSTVLPVANFSTNVTSGYAPLSVQFTDLSQNAISRSWDFNNDGSIDSTDTNPVYTYLTQGTYKVNLTVSNVNGSVSKTASIKVLQTNSSGKGGSNDNSGGGDSEGKAVIVRNDANDSTTNTAATASVSPTENNNGQSSTPANVEPTPVQTSTGTPAKESKKTPGFGLLCGITGLLTVYLYRRK